MPRTNRKISFNNTYHIMLRGINKQNIFNDNLDRNKFLRALKETKERYQYKLYAYCLMNNHVHLLICDSKQKISSIIQSLAIKYSLYFNKKYDRVGHLFQNRYKSKCVENKRYLLNLIRYIHQNPEKANLATTKDYRWSSFKEYFSKSTFIDESDILELFDFNINQFTTFNLKYVDNHIEELEFEFLNKFDDKRATQIIKEKLNILNLEEIVSYNVILRNNYIKNMKNIEGISSAQISRILNLNRKIVERA